MRRFAAQYIITATGDILKRGVITCDDDGIITDISDTAGNFKETSATPFYNGIIVPGFVNCHSHIELSDMKGITSRGSGLGTFIRDVRDKRNPSEEKASLAISQADRELYLTGTSGLADICNTSLTFETKENSRIKYINFLEVFGIDPGKANRRIAEINMLKATADALSSPSYVVPHSVYSISLPLFKELSHQISDNALTSIHFLESEQERDLLDKLEGDLIDSYSKMGISMEMLEERVPGHMYALNNLLPEKGKLLLVHATFADSEIIRMAQQRGDIFWCLCPNSNIYIENSLPPLVEILENSGTVVLGTDSLASNSSLNLLEEIKTLQNHFPDIGLPEMIEWATRNGALALDMDTLGTIEIGKAPGLVLLEHCDLENLKLRSESSSVRLI
jgi:cytosine/adenosine deaminase-related metal-dependent hydrolase